MLSNTTMETISLRLEGEFLKDVKQLMKKHRYATMTEFVRAALREKVNELENKEILERITTLTCSSKRKTTDAQLHEAGEKEFALLEKKFARKGV